MKELKDPLKVTIKEENLDTSDDIFAGLPKRSEKTELPGKFGINEETLGQKNNDNVVLDKTEKGNLIASEFWARAGDGVNFSDQPGRITLN